MELVEDLGIVKGRRRGLYKCTQCNETTERDTSNYKRNPDGVCKKCSTKNSKTTHGKTNSRLYNIWVTMRARCSNPKNTEYSRYGAKGVTVCDEWESSFIAFYDWSIANGYHKKLVIDKDILSEEQGLTAKVYSPTTCMWITNQQNSEQARGIPVIQTDLEGNFIAEYPSARVASTLTGWNKSHISAVMRGERKTTGGFKWKKKHV